MNSKLLGSILLTTGTSIGAGMLALPIATAPLGFGGALVLLVVAWFAMTMAALLMLEVNLSLPDRSHLISMAGATIGVFGQMLTWALYLLLLYSLLCAYIAGGSDLFHRLLEISHIILPDTVTTLLFTLLFGSIVYQGIHVVDQANRWLMFVKLGSYLLIVLMLIPAISIEKLELSYLNHANFSTAVMVTVTSFGYATLIPSLRIYFAGDVRNLKLSILIGSAIPLLCYIFWDAIVMGIIPFKGGTGLETIMQSAHSTSDLMQALNAATTRGSVIFFVKLFTSICMVTSFLGVALCLVDFLADGLQMEKTGWRHLFIHAVTFLPPVLIVLFFPNVFIQALAYAGLDCVLLLMLLPAWMAWGRRYRRHFNQGGYQVWGGKGLLIGLITLSLGLVALYLR